MFIKYANKNLSHGLCFDVFCTLGKLSGVGKDLNILIEARHMSDNIMNYLGCAPNTFVKSGSRSSVNLMKNVP